MRRRKREHKRERERDYKAGARSFFQASHVGNRGLSAQAVLHCFSKTISNWLAWKSSQDRNHHLYKVLALQAVVLSSLCKKTGE